MINDIKLSPMETAPKDGYMFFISYCGDYESIAWDEDSMEFCWDGDATDPVDLTELAGVEGWWRLGKEEVAR